MTNMGQAVDKAQIGEMSFWEHLDVLIENILKDVVHLVKPALLRCRLAVSFRHILMN